MDDIAVDGSRELRITMPTAQAEVLGGDASTLAHEAAWLMWVVYVLRAGAEPEEPSEQWYDAVAAMCSLQRHVEGAMAAVMRDRVATDRDGLSLAELARATKVSRSTAQTRRERVLSRPADAAELWATRAVL